MKMKPRRKSVLAVGALLSMLIVPWVALSAEQSGNKGDAADAKGSSKTLAQRIEEVRNSINEAWQKLTNPKTVEPARNKVNEAYKELSDAAAAAVESSDKSRKETRDKKDK